MEEGKEASLKVWGGARFRVYLQGLRPIGSRFHVFLMIPTAVMIERTPLVPMFQVTSRVSQTLHTRPYAAMHSPLESQSKPQNSIETLTNPTPQSSLNLQSPKHNIPRPSIYPLLDPKYPLFGTRYPYLRVQGGSWSP